MADTFTQLFVHIVFSVKGRQALIHPNWEENLFKYITGTIKNKGQKLMIINGVPDHIHILVGIKPNCSISDLVREIKKSSTEYINTEKFVPGKFQWQKGFGAFSHSTSQVPHVVTYIKNQKNHHKATTFKDEYEKWLDDFEIAYKPEHLFEWID